MQASTLTAVYDEAALESEVVIPLAVNDPTSEATLQQLIEESAKRRFTTDLVVSTYLRILGRRRRRPSLPCDCERGAAVKACMPHL